MQAQDGDADAVECSRDSPSSQQKHGVLQLTDPVVYAAPAPRVAGAHTIRAGLQEEMELGHILDMAFFSKAGNSGCMGQPSTTEVEHLAVISHRWVS